MNSWWHGNPLQYSCLENPMDRGAWWAAFHGVARSWTQLSDFTFTFHFLALEKEMATHSSVLAWRIPGTGEPDGLPSVGSHRVGHDWSNLAAAAAAAGSYWDLPGGASGKEPACQCRRCKILQVRSQGREDPLEEGIATHSWILENPMDRGAWRATVCTVAESQTWQWLSTHIGSYYVMRRIRHQR